MQSEKYREYIRSPEWDAKRRQVMRRSGERCERCKKARALHVHHLTYARLGNERLEDLEALCENCHALAHPGKEGLRGAFVGSAQCRCGSTEAEVYVGEDRIYTVCIHCGAEGQRKRRAPVRKRRAPKARRKGKRGKQVAQREDQAKLSRDTKRASARIDRRYGRGGKKFGEF